MRIGFDAHVFDGRDQGTKTLLLRLIETLARRYPEHDVFVYAEEPHPELDFTRANLHHRPLIRRNAAHHLLRALPHAARCDRLDTMVFNYIHSPLMRNATVIIHDILPQTHPRFFPARFVAQCWAFFGMSSLLARHLFTVSDYSRDEIRRIYPWTKDKAITVLHPGASFPKSVYFDRPPSPTSAADEGRYILIVGRIETRKNVQTAIDAFRLGAPADVRLIIVGRREPGIAIETYGDPRIVERVGVSNVELVELYRGADLFLYPSLAEGFGLPLLDAILFGLPVIASNRTSMLEVGAECVTMFDPTAADATKRLSAAIEQHFGDAPITPPTLANRRARAALYSWDNAVDEFMRGIGDAS